MAVAEPPPPPPPPPSPCLPARVHEPTRVSLQGWTNGRLRDRWSNTLHTSLPVCNMSSSPATAVFPFRGNCRFSVIYIHTPSLSLPPFHSTRYWKEADDEGEGMVILFSVSMQSGGILGSKETGGSELKRN